MTLSDVYGAPENPSFEATQIVHFIHSEMNVVASGLRNRQSKIAHREPDCVDKPVCNDNGPQIPSPQYGRDAAHNCADTNRNHADGPLIEVS